jgi:hypothetical protein
MANPEHVAILTQGVAEWNAWRHRYPDIIPDLSELHDHDPHFYWRGRDLSNVDLSRAALLGTDLSEAKLTGAQFIAATLQSAQLAGADLSKADFWNADLFAAKLAGAKLFRTNLHSANLHGAVLSRAQLAHVTLTQANLTQAVFAEATLTDVDLRRAVLVQTDFQHATLRDCRVYGISAWDLRLDGAVQIDLRIGKERANPITVDDLEVAQFIYLLLHNQKIRDVINTLGKRGVLLLGRFTAERKPVLEAMRAELRRLGYLPIVFDFERPTERDFTETVMVLAGMSLFVVADITNPKSSPLELQATVPNYMIPFVPILQEGETPFAMFVDLQRKYDWVLDLLTYDSVERLVRGFETDVVRPALAKHDAFVMRKTAALRVRRIGDGL